jgi:hypothetical protein
VVGSKIQHEHPTFHELLELTLKMMVGALEIISWKPFIS